MKNNMKQGEIWKFPLRATDRQIVLMPEGAEILCAQMQGPVLCIWAFIEEDKKATEEDKKATMIHRTFDVVGTGHSMDPANRTYIGTVQMHGGLLILHVFENHSR
jgi:hypothetical protein